MATFSKEIVQHFTHCFHPLTQVWTDKEFLCKGCRTPGSGTRYRCELCGLDLHQYCVRCPMELSSFMHQHSLKLVGCKPGHVCDLCEDPVQGLFYRCELCDFSVHPVCTQLPEYTRHVRHKDHPLRLEISVPIGCMVCKDMCSSWRYRCEVCCFHLHLHCTLAPCVEETTMLKTKTQSLGAPAPPQPSTWAPAFGAHSGAYDYGRIPPPPPQYFAQASVPSNNIHGYGGTPPNTQYSAHPYVTPHVHGYGGKVIPPPNYVAQPSFPPHTHGYEGIFTSSPRSPPSQYLIQPSCPPHARGYGGIPPPHTSPSSPSFPPPPHTPSSPRYVAQPSFPPHVHGYEGIFTPFPRSPPPHVRGHGGIPPPLPPPSHTHIPPQHTAQPSCSTDHAPSSGSEAQEDGKKLRKRIYEVVWELTSDVLANMIAGELDS